MFIFIFIANLVSFSGFSFDLLPPVSGLEVLAGGLLVLGVLGGGASASPLTPGCLAGGGDVV